MIANSLTITFTEGRLFRNSLRICKRFSNLVRLLLTAINNRGMRGFIPLYFSIGTFFRVIAFDNMHPHAFYKVVTRFIASELHLTVIRRDQMYRVRGRDLSREIIVEMTCILD